MKRPFIRGPITPFRGQKRSPWLLTTYQSWDDHPSSPLEIKEGFWGSTAMGPCPWGQVSHWECAQQPTRTGSPWQRWSGKKSLPRWWQLKYFWNFHPELWGRWTQFDEHIFQMGWNHQPAPTLGILTDFDLWNVRNLKCKGNMIEFTPV